jgi:hypothetical protein
MLRQKSSSEGLKVSKVALLILYFVQKIKQSESFTQFIHDIYYCIKLTKINRMTWIKCAEETAAVHARSILHVMTTLL